MGKTLADLQSNISISAANAVTGDIEWCSGYTQFSTDIGEQAGWYLALQVTPDVEDATVTAAYNGTIRELDNNIYIIRLADGEDTITFTAEKEGYTTGRLTLDLSGLNKETITNYCYVTSLTNGVTVTPLQFGESKILSGVVPYDTTTSSNHFTLKYRTFIPIPNGSEISVSHFGTELGASTFSTVTPQEGESYSEATVDITITQDILDSQSPGLSTLIIPDTGEVLDRFYCSLGVENLTLEAAPAPYTADTQIVIPAADEMVASSTNLTSYDQAYDVPASEYFDSTNIPTINSSTHEITGTLNYGNCDNKHWTYSSWPQDVSYRGDQKISNIARSLIILKIIKPTNAPSTYRCSYQANNSIETGVTFLKDQNYGYIYLDAETTTTLTIRAFDYDTTTGTRSNEFTFTYNWSYTSSGSGNSFIYNELNYPYPPNFLHCVPAGVAVSNVEDASGNSLIGENFISGANSYNWFNGSYTDVRKRQWVQNLKTPKPVLHYMTGLKYTDTQEAIPDGYYLPLVVNYRYSWQQPGIKYLLNSIDNILTYGTDLTANITNIILWPIPTTGRISVDMQAAGYPSLSAILFPDYFTFDPPIAPAANFVNNGSVITLNNTDALYKDAASTGTDTFQAGQYITNSTTNSSGSSYSGTSSAPYKVDVTANPVATDTWTAGFIITGGTNGNTPVLETGTTGTLTDWSVKMASDNKTITITYHGAVTTYASAKVYYSTTSGGTKHVLLTINPVT